MPVYKIVGNYQIFADAVAVHPSATTFYTINFDTAEQVKQFIIANAAAKNAAVAPLDRMMGLLSSLRESTINTQVAG